MNAYVLEMQAYARRVFWPRCSCSTANEKRESNVDNLLRGAACCAACVRCGFLVDHHITFKCTAGIPLGGLSLQGDKCSSDGSG